MSLITVHIGLNQNELNQIICCIRSNLIRSFSRQLFVANVCGNASIETAHEVVDHYVENLHINCGYLSWFKLYLAVLNILLNYEITVVWLVCLLPLMEQQNDIANTSPK